VFRRFAFLLLGLPAPIFAQNLVLNPGFEQHIGCPDKPGQINLSAFWVSPSMATPDYFNSCSPGLEYGTEFNKKGGQVAHAGQAYAGLQFYYLNRNEFSEYIQTKLEAGLGPGQLYCIKAFVSLGNSDYAFRELGALLSVTEIKSQDVLKFKLPFTALGNGQYLLDQDEWMCVRGLYRAKGNERLLTIGDFSAEDPFWNIHTHSATDSLLKSAFYFIDDISLEAIRDSSECGCLK